MSSDNAKDLCLSLLRADTEVEVVDLLTKAGYWGDSSCWRFYGDTENNYGQFGNQQARSDAALVEKVVNSVDACLIRRCHEAKTDPESDSAPRSIREAVAVFYEGASFPVPESAGRISDWPSKKRLDVAQEITVALTGYAARKGSPSITVSDSGEGQTPRLMPDTLLSLGKSNKLRIPFVQGKFNMGGTGALEFCGRRNLQLVISRRHPALPVPAGDNSASLWGFTIVRRDDPGEGRRHSTYVYLAPQGEVLSFAANSLPLFPDKGNAYAREGRWGTAIKLYEYAATGYSNTNALMKGGLMRRLDLLLPELALPVRLHECRDRYTEKGHEGSSANNMTGLRTRLEDDKSSNLEVPPIHYPLTVSGETLVVTVYAFKRDRKETYAGKSDGVLFAINGQAHGFLTRDFFRRRSVGMGYLDDSLLVIVDCSGLSSRSREQLFMSSRDRLRGGERKESIERTLEDVIKNDSMLRDLKMRRREDDINQKLVDDKPLEDVLAQMLKHSPTLSTILLKGARLPNPFKPAGGGGGQKPPKLRRFPTFFKFRGKSPEEDLNREVAINRRARIQYETDAQDDYFSRRREAGEFELWLESDGISKSVSDFTGPNLSGGIATLSIELPNNCMEGDTLVFGCRVNDKTRIDAIDNRMVLTVAKPVHGGGGGTSDRKKPASGSGPDHGSGAGGGADSPGGFALPPVTKVYEAEWGKHGFDKFSALKVVASGSDEDAQTYDFFVNVDNLYLKTEMKQNVGSATLTEAKFIFGMVLLGLGLIHESTQSAGTKESAAAEGEVAIEEQIKVVTRAIAPVLIPMINELGGLEDDFGLGVVGN